MWVWTLRVRVRVRDETCVGMGALEIKRSGLSSTGGPPTNGPHCCSPSACRGGHSDDLCAGILGASPAGPPPPPTADGA